MYFFTNVKQQGCLVFALLLPGCNHPADQHPKEFSPTYPVYIDGGAKRTEQEARPGKNGEELYLDTITLSKAVSDKNEPALHPLSPFSLSYEEWKTIGCVISIDEAEHWEKQMIGLVQKSGALRIRYQGRDILLKSRVKKPFKEGLWANTYANDTIEIKLRALLEPKRIMSRLTGFGEVEGNIGKVSFHEEGCYFVAKPNQ